MGGFDVPARQRRTRLFILLFCAILWSTVQAPFARADGSHSDPVPSSGGVGRLTYRGFQFELLTSPQPLRAKQNSKLIIQTARHGTLEPVRDAVILMGAGPAEPAFGNSHNHGGPDLSRAFEDVWAGNYVIDYTPQRDGRHVVTVALMQLGEMRLSPPEFLEFQFNVSAASGWLSFLPWFLAAAAVAAAGIGWIVIRSRAPAADLQPDLLEIGWVNRFFQSKSFPAAFQVPVLVVTVLIVFLGLVDRSDSSQNFATRLTWILWWPGIILTFILVGRLWCVVCPFGIINEWTAKLRKPARRIPKALRGMTLATALFLILTWADEQLGIVRSPQMTAWLIILLALAAMGTGLFFQRRSFCRYLCPITGLQGLYSMVSPIELRAENPARCRSNCRQDCYRGNDTGDGCPMFEFAATLDRNMYCNFCLECVKGCPQDNLSLRFRRFGKDLWASSHRSKGEAYLALVLVGVTSVVTAQMLPLWPELIASLSKSIPLPLRIWMKPVNYLALTETAVFFLVSLVLVPLLGLGAARFSARLIGAPEKETGKLWTTFAYLFIPIGLAMHLAHNFSHIFLEGGSLAPALQHAVNRFTPFTFGEPVWTVSPLVAAEVVSWLQMIFVLGGLAFSMTVGYRLARKFFDQRELRGKALLPFFAVALFFTLLNLYLLAQPMGARHAM
jgi:ferredoxin